MHERDAFVGGELQIESDDEQSTSVRLRVPLPQGTPE
jgi:signal transduction histidine kinase